jgi:ABC-2 type transport system permease protein
VTAAVIAVTNLRRMLRDRTNLFFVFVLPIVLVFVLGAIGGQDPRIGLVVEDQGPLAGELARELVALPDLEVRPVDDFGSAAELLRGDGLDGVVVVPAGYDRDLRAGEPVTVRFAASPEDGLALRGLVESAVASQSNRVRAALVAMALRPVDFDRAHAAAGAGQAVPPVSVSVVTPGGEPFARGVSRVDQVASQQLVLFVFITGLTAATALIQTRQLGVSRRMLATPTGLGRILLGEAAGRWLVTLLQGLFIAAATSALFGVGWGSVPGSLAVIVAFSLVAAGAAMVVGAAFRNESQAAAAAVAVSLGLGALGGSMVPLEVFPDAVRTVAFATPHAWANDAFDRLVREGRPVGDVAANVAILVGYAAALFAVATVVLRRSLLRG